MIGMRELFQNVSQVWVLTDKLGKVVLSSRSVGDYQSLLPAPIREGSSLLDSVPSSWKAFATNLLNELVDEEASSVEVQFIDGSGGERYFEIECKGILGTDGPRSHVFIEARDVTAQKIFEKKITLLLNEYQSMIENANAVIIGTDSKGQVTEWNEMAQRVLGYTRDESFFKDVGVFFAAESQDEYRRMINDVLAGNISSISQLHVRAQDGRVLTLLINATPKRGSSNQVVGCLLIAQDITELAAYRESLERQVKERTEVLKVALENEKRLVEIKDRFVSMASHEFRSPIDYIHRNIEKIRSQINSLTVTDIVAGLSKIQTQTEHLSALLEDVLTMGKTNAPRPGIKPNLKRVDLRQCLLRIIDEVQTNSQQTHKVQIDFPETSIWLQSDENLLRNVFVNLLTNAVKFSPGADKVAVSVRAFSSHVEVEVRDWGLGIEEKDLEKVFEPFHRGGNVDGIKGTGLGLPIVRKAAETLSATVSVASNVGEGTRFTVKLKHP